MAAEERVDVTYRGLEVGKDVTLTELGPSTGFVSLPRPLPVGAEVAITTDAGLVRARVLRVHEQVAGEENPGMRVGLIEPNAKVGKWWQALADRKDPVIPERPVDPNQPAVQEPEPAPAVEAIPEEIEDQVTEPHAARKKKQPARTQMMSADEIRAAVAEGGHEVSFDEGASAPDSPDDAPDPEDTLRMGSGAVTEDDQSGDSEDNGKKKRKRKRKRKR